ncbi:MAG: biotin/lipoyl-containing protein [Planctomycetota bacterium]
MKYFAHTTLGERCFEFRRDGRRILAVETLEDGSSRTFEVDLSPGSDGAVSLLVDGRNIDCLIERAGSSTVVQLLGERVVLEVEDERERAAAAVAGHKGGLGQLIEAAMPGVVVDIQCAEGDTVVAGSTIVILEAMKMQNPMHVEADGVVSKVHVEVGQAVSAGELLIEIDPPEESS